MLDRYDRWLEGGGNPMDEEDDLYEDEERDDIDDLYDKANWEYKSRIEYKLEQELEERKNK